MARRRSARLSGAAIGAPAATTTSEEDELLESDYESESPALKKRKVSKDGTGNAKRRTSRKKPMTARSRTQGKLAIFMSMPFDVMCEIFSAVESADLLALARTSRGIRQILTGPVHTEIWRHARLNVQGSPVPAPPAGMPERAWAHLLFGGSGCYTCQAKNVPILFGLQRRACARCKKMFLVTDGAQDLLLWMRVAHDVHLTSLVGCIDAARYDIRKSYWRPDLERMLRRVEQLRLGAQPIAGPLAEVQFVDSRLEQVRANAKVLHAAERWEAERRKLASDQRHAIRDRNSNTMIARFTAAGYDPRDFSCIWKAVDGQRELQTEKALSRLHSEIEPKIIQVRDARLRREERERLLTHSRHAAWLYCEQFLPTLVPLQWLYLPMPQNVLDNHCLDIPCLERLIADDRDDIPEQEWADAVAELPRDLSAYLVSRLNSLSASGDAPALPASFALATASDGSTPALLDALALQFSALDLAQSVQCVQHGTARFWTAGSRNLNVVASTWSHAPVLVEDWPAGAAAVRDVLQLVKKDSAATTRELDISCGGVWFKCETCSAAVDEPQSTLLHLGWRSYVQHCFDAPDAAHRPAFAPDDIAVNVADPSRDAEHRAWACMHCPQYRTELVGHSDMLDELRGDMEAFVRSGYFTFASNEMRSWPELVEHNKAIHGIDEPREHYDIFYGDSTKPRPTTTARVDSTAVRS